MLDLYELIGVPETASAVWIERSHQAARGRIETDKKLTKKQRAATLASLDEAYQTLADPINRLAYDQRLENWREAKARGGPIVLLRRIVFGMLAVGIIGASAYWYRERESERIRFEEERVQSEIAEKKRLAATAEQRRASDELLQKEAIDRKQEEEKRLELAREQRAQDASTQRYMVDDRYEKAQREKKFENDRQQRLNEELRARFESDRTRQQAQVEVDRQRRFVEQREREAAFVAQQSQAAERLRLMQEQAKNR